MGRIFTECSQKEIRFKNRTIFLPFSNFPLPERFVPVIQNIASSKTGYSNQTQSSPGTYKTKRKRGKIFRNFLSCEVRMARLELAQENSHYPLKVARLPFRHIRLNWDCKGTAKF